VPGAKRGVGVGAYCIRPGRTGTPWRIQFAHTGFARTSPWFFVSLRMDSVAYDRLFENVDFSEQSLQIGEYEVCTFVNCNFMGVDMCGIQLTECVFFGCDLSNAQIATTAFRDACFKDCKMVGMQFKLHTDFLFSVSFEGCNLHLSSFYRMSLKKMKFKNCILREVDFTSADLTESSFDGCDLLGAVFSDSNLEKVDFRKSNFYSIDLEQNRVKKAKFSLHGLPGLLGKYNIEIED
jgi:uncharacterized protein YjbI with pentapeptide repeats